MRVTNNMITSNTKSNINANKVLVDKYNTQMTTQKKINKPSDDPVIAIRSLRMQTSLSHIDQYLNNNISDANSWLNVTPWGEGRPGWHTECAAMVHRYLGTPIDIHGGGSDLAFPHHENECAQATCAWHQGFSNTWMHTGMLLVDGEKMSKSLGNFFTLAEVLEQHSAAALRLLMLQTSYRSPLDFSWERLDGAENSLTRIAGTVENLRWAANHATADADEAASEAFAAKAAEARAAFKECMDDDFNTAGAMGAVFGFVTECNQYLEQAGDAADKAAALAAADTLVELLDTFGVELPEPKVELPLGLLGVAAGLVAYTGDDVDEAAAKILEARAEARAAKNWDLADAIRDQLKDLGLTIEDTAAGTRIKSL